MIIEEIGKKNTQRNNYKNTKIQNYKTKSSKKVVIEDVGEENTGNNYKNTKYPKLFFLMRWRLRRWEQRRHKDIVIKKNTKLLLFKIVLIRW